MSYLEADGAARREGDVRVEHALPDLGPAGAGERHGTAGFGAVSAKDRLGQAGEAGSPEHELYRTAFHDR